MSEIPSSMQREALEWAMAQDEKIIDAVTHWKEGELSEDDLLTFVGNFTYIKSMDDRWADPYGSVDVFIRLFDDGVLTADMYDKILRHIIPYIMR